MTLRHEVAIYALVCDIPSENIRFPIYIGQTVNPTERLSQHLGRQCHSDLLRYRIECARRLAGRWPVMDILEWVTRDMANLSERYWISSLVREGMRPANFGPWNAGDLEDMAEGWYPRDRG